MRIKRSRWGSEYDRLDSEAMRLTKHKQLKTRTLEELLRLAKLLKIRLKHKQRSITTWSRRSLTMIELFKSF